MRVEIPRFEQVLGALILCFLVVLGFGLYIKGQRYDPYRFVLDPAALESTRAEVFGKAATLRADDMRGFENSGGQRPMTETGASTKVLPAMVEGFTPMGATEHYLPDTLFEKINGRAPAYLEFNFQELTSRSFTMDGAPDQFVDVFIFSMDTPLNAFGIFSLERDGVGAAVDFVKDGYRSEMGFFFRQGLAYVQILASDSAALVMNPAESFARSLAASIPVDDSGLGAMALLPAVNQVPGSMNYIQANAYGQSLLTDVYEASYLHGGDVLAFFAMQASSQDSANLAWEQLEGFNRNYAEVTDSGEIADARFIISDNFGEWNVLFIRGQAIGGVVNASDPDLAREFVEAYLTGKNLGISSPPIAPVLEEEEDEPYGGR